jgi:hypothetical protein
VTVSTRWITCAGDDRGWQVFERFKMRTDAHFYVVCDGPDCYEDQEIACTATARGWDDRNASEDIREAGWEVNDSGDFCSWQCYQNYLLEKN